MRDKIAEIIADAFCTVRDELIADRILALPELVEKFQKAEKYDIQKDALIGISTWFDTFFKMMPTNRFNDLMDSLKLHIENIGKALEGGKG